MSTYATDAPDWCAQYRAWLEASTGIKSRRTLTRNAREACSYIDWCESNGIDVALASTNDVARWIHRPRLDGLAAADSTRYHRRELIASLYRWLMADPDNHVYDNPARRVRAVMPDRARPVTPMRLLASDEIAALLRAADEWTASPTRSRNRLIIALLAHHGMRPSEIRTARVMDYRRRSAQIRTQIGRSRPQWRHLHPDVIARIEHYLTAVRSGPTSGRQAWLVLSQRGGQIDDGSVWRLVRSLSTRAGIDAPGEVSPYSFRRTLLADGRSAGLDMSQLSALAGHRSEATTARYLRRVSGAVDAGPVWSWRERQTAAAEAS